LNEYKSEVTRAIIQGSGIAFVIILAFIIAIFVMKLIFEKKESTSFVKTIAYIIATVVFVIALMTSIVHTVDKVKYYKGLKDIKGTVEKIQYFGEYGIDTEHELSAIELKDEKGDKSKYVLHGEHVPNLDKGTKMKITYSENNSDNIKGNIKTYISY